MNKEELKIYLQERKYKYDCLEMEDAKAKKQGLLVGRYIAEPIGDGKAIYLITKENKKTVRMEWWEHCEYSVPYWGKATSVSKTYVLQRLHSRDCLAQLFKK